MDQVNIKLNNINFIILGIVATILWRYPVVNKFYFAYLAFLMVLLTIHLLDKELTILKTNMWYIAFSIVGLCYLLIATLQAPRNIEMFATKYSLSFATLFYMYIKFNRKDVRFAETFFKQLTILLNICSIMNLYQVIFHKPLLLNYMNLLEVGYSYQFGTFAYRTMSVFNHPIISGLFFTIAFFCNHYVLKTKLKLPLQFLLLVNVYTSWSRSAWLIFANINSLDVPMPYPNNKWYKSDWNM